VPVFLDANVFMYVLGSDHPLKNSSIRVAQLVAEHPAEFVTDAEVVQELLHRYLAVRNAERARVAVREYVALMEGRIEPIYVEDVVSATDMLPQHQRLSARDLLHAAVMRRLGVDQIVTTDADFEVMEGVTRLDPAAVDAWGARVVGLT
jgi:predicted nucleic acid-binding protein